MQLKLFLKCRKPLNINRVLTYRMAYKYGQESLQYYRSALKDILSKRFKHIFDRLPEQFFNQRERDVQKTTNLYYDKGSNLTVEFNTIHGIKGKDILYLETEHKGGTNIKRRIPLLKRKQ